MTRTNYTRIGLYQIRSEISNNGRTIVLKGFEQSMNEYAAIKIMPRDFWDDPAFRARFERESQAITLLEHPAIVPVIDMGLIDNQPYIIMEYLPGGTLADRLVRGPISLEESYQILYHLASALDAVHEKGVLHNDLKPANILFDENGDAYLSDFGHFKLSPAHIGTLSFNIIYGAPATMSPELALGQTGIDGRSDIYSLGAILFHMLTGQPLYGGDSILEQVANQISAEIPSACAINPGLPPECDKLFAYALAKDPAGRFQSASNLMEGLAAVIEGRPIEVARPATFQSGLPGAAPQASPGDGMVEDNRPPQRRRHLAAVWLPLLLLTLLITGAAFSETLHWFDFSPVRSYISALAGKPAPTQAPSPTLPAPMTETPRAAQVIENTPATGPTSVAATATPRSLLPAIENPTSDTIVEKPLVIGGADKIAFINENNVWIANLDGSDQQQMTDDKENQKWDLRWTATGLEYNSKTGIHTISSVKGQTGTTLYTNSDSSQYGGSYTKVAADGSRTATVIRISQQGMRVDAVHVYDRNGVLVDQIPGIRFSMSGYSGPDSTHSITDYGWNGDLLFALHGNVLFEMGDLMIYNTETHNVEKANPIKDQCCYQDIQWSPDGQYLLFVFKDNRYNNAKQIYYVPYGSLSKDMDYTPVQLPFYFFSDPAARVYPALRSVYNAPDASSAPTPATVNFNSDPSSPGVALGGADKVAVVNKNDIWASNLDGSGLQQVTNDGSAKDSLQWTLDGKTILFRQNGCWKATLPGANEFLTLGCYLDLALSQDGQEVVISENVQLPNATVRLMSYLVPYNLTRLAHIKVISQALGLGGYEMLSGRDFHLSNDRQRFAQIVTITKDGQKVDEVQVFDFVPPGRSPSRLDSFPAERFYLPGYRESYPKPYVLSNFGWNGDNLFALYGQKINGFGELVIYDTTTGREQILNPINKNCCYQDIEWSPDRTYLGFTFQVGDLTRLYYLPYDSLSTPTDHTPLSFPAGFFADPSIRVSPVFRPAGWKVKTIQEPIPAADATIKPELLSSQNKQDNWVMSVAFSPDAKSFVTASGNQVSLWSATQADEKLMTFTDLRTKHTDMVTSVAYSPDGSYVASGSADGTAILWRVSNGQAKFQMTGHFGPVNAVAFSPDGEYLATASSDQTVKIWRTGNAGLKVTLKGHTASVSSVAFSKDGQFIAAGAADNTVLIWRVKEETLYKPLTGHTRPVWSVAFSPDGKYLASASWDGTVKLWNLSDGTLARTLQGHQDGVESIAFSPDSSLLVSGSDDKTTRLWRVSDGALVSTLAEHEDGILSVAFSADGSMIASGGFDKTVRLWNLKP